LADSREDYVRGEAVAGLENRHFEDIFIMDRFIKDMGKSVSGLMRVREKKRIE
jgi:hypothetical protein